MEKHVNDKTIWQNRDNRDKLNATIATALECLTTKSNCDSDVNKSYD